MATSICKKECFYIKGSKYLYQNKDVDYFHDSHSLAKKLPETGSSCPSLLLGCCADVGIGIQKRTHSCGNAGSSNGWDCLDNLLATKQEWGEVLFPPDFRRYVNGLYSKAFFDLFRRCPVGFYVPVPLTCIGSFLLILFFIFL